jgi:hypothetical protein
MNRDLFKARMLAAIDIWLPKEPAVVRDNVLDSALRAFDEARSADYRAALPIGGAK